MEELKCPICSSTVIKSNIGGIEWVTIYQYECTKCKYKTRIKANVIPTQEAG